jgi:hypothetical protein
MGDHFTLPMAAKLVGIWIMNNELGNFRFVYIDRSVPHTTSVPDDELYRPATKKRF